MKNPLIRFIFVAIILFCYPSLGLADRIVTWMQRNKYIKGKGLFELVLIAFMISFLVLMLIMTIFVVGVAERFSGGL